MVFLQLGGFYSGTIGGILSQWEQLGVFSYVLPFLLIFALIFGILSRIDLFKGNKGIHSIIALSVALMALQFSAVPLFFADIFPKLGIGLAVILVGIILTSLFTDSNYTWIGITLGGVVFFIVVGNSFEFGDSPFWFFVQQNLPTIILVAVVLIIVLTSIFGPPHFNPEGDSHYGTSVKGH